MRNIGLFIVSFLIIISNLQAVEDSKMLRYPNTSKTEVTFSYAGNIWVAPITGGIARKLTSSPGIEIYPRFSPNGKQIAFVGEYEGNPDIYVMPSLGGQPKRITYSLDMPDVAERQGPAKIIMQWTPDGKNILYRSREESWNVLSGKLYLVPADGGIPKDLPLARSGFASLSPDGGRIAMNRIFREYRTWKRYRGGQADDIWIYDFKNKSLENITNNPAQDIIPMWVGNKIYFLSDRDKVMNLFCYDLNTKQTKKVTNFTQYDVKFPSLGAEHIAFENAGEIYILKIENDYLQKLDIFVYDDNNDFRPSFVDVRKYITNATISPDGKAALFVARGDIFVVPAKNGYPKNLTNTNAVHERNAQWSPDGKWIAFISDETGEDEIYIMRPDGSQKTRLTSDGVTYRWELLWSPDSKKILNSDKLMRLFYVDVETKKVTYITKSKIWEIRDFSWSPDSRWIAYTDLINNYTPIVNLYSLDENKSYQVTSEFFESNGAVFSPDGKYLYFISKRTFNPTVGSFEYNFTYNNLEKIYGYALSKNTKNPLIKFEDYTKEKSDTSETEKPSKKTTKKIEKSIQENIKIDFDGLSDRIFELPIPAANYSSLITNKNEIYYLRRTNNSSALYKYDFEKLEESKIGDFTMFDISNDFKSILFKIKDEYYIEKLKEDLKPKDGKLDLSDMKIYIDRKKEWEQIYNETWRQMRDFFYDPNMHGVDWLAVKKKYEVLLPHISHRADLTYLLGEMVGELNAGHAYVGGGDMPKVEPQNIGYLGADYEFDEKTGFYRIKKIYQGQNWNESRRSPLTETGLDIKEGDWLLEIDGVRLSKEMTPNRVLVGKAEKFVTLRYNGRPSLEKSQTAVVKTLSRETDLRYYNWVERNRSFVDSATGGRVGYVHIPDMMPDNGLNEFVKYFYPQVRKEALIIDDRFNGGGNVSSLIIERLRRILAVARNTRNQEMVFTTPSAVMTGPMVMLINEQSMSDGDLFPYQFKLMGLGKLIGKRTWGGVIGIRGSLPFLDGGYLNKPEFANFGRDGNWILEGVGMEPDIEIDNNPGLEYEGYDAQLLKAIEVILEELKTDTKPKIPKVPEYPIKK